MATLGSEREGSDEPADIMSSTSKGRGKRKRNNTFPVTRVVIAIGLVVVGSVSVFCFYLSSFTHEQHAVLSHTSHPVAQVYPTVQEENHALPEINRSLQNERVLESLGLRGAPILPKEDKVAVIQVITPTTSQMITEMPKRVDFPKPLQYSTTNSGANDSQAVLVVGGTDGSGTRRVVQVLTELGVTMVSEDPETYDIHADIIGGWPPIVKPVISATKSLLYDPTSLRYTPHKGINT